MKKIKIITIIGTRPEIIKMSSLIQLMDKEFNHILVHSGQHYDYEMDKIFFKDLNIRDPDYMLNVGSKGHAAQTASIIIKSEKILLKENPDWVIVFADPNTPLAGALVASKLNIPLIHLEAGCRSFNKSMPEEINRIVCDHCADLLLAPDDVARKNLLREGLSKDKIHAVGSTIIEVSLRNIIQARRKSKIMQKLGLKKGDFVLLTLHRAENTNDPKILAQLINAAEVLSEKINIVFPLHPRTEKILNNNHIKIKGKIKTIKPQGYLDFLLLIDNCLFIMSDSGSIQEEAGALNIPCMILRNETEWTYLVDAGKNLLLGTDRDNIIKEISNLLDNRNKIEDIKKIKLEMHKDVSSKVVQIIKNESKK